MSHANSRIQPLDLIVVWVKRLNFLVLKQVLAAVSVYHIAGFCQESLRDSFSSERIRTKESFCVDPVRDKTQIALVLSDVAALLEMRKRIGFLKSEINRGWIRIFNWTAILSWVLLSKSWTLHSTFRLIDRLSYRFTESHGHSWWPCSARPASSSDRLTNGLIASMYSAGQIWSARIRLVDKATRKKHQWVRIKLTPPW